MKPDKHPDAERIQALGGPTALANRLGLTEPGRVQRVQNWIKRGIPAEVKLAHPELFLDLRRPKRPRTEPEAAAQAG